MARQLTNPCLPFSLLSLLALFICCLPARPDTILFSDLGSGANVYNYLVTWVIEGSGFDGGTSVADEFMVGGTGRYNVTQIDLAVTDFYNPNFYATIWTDVNGSLGFEVPNAYWSASAPNYTPALGYCCSNIASVTGITGVSLAGGQDYFLVLGALNPATGVSFDTNTQGDTADEQYSLNGGLTWNDNGLQTLGAFDVLGTPAPVPEPAETLPIFVGTGLVIVTRRSIRGEIALCVRVRTRRR
jgi:hypothetical protein